jgi:hypothetical protein
MYHRSFIVVLIIGLLRTIANASEEPTISFIDGLWKGGIGADSQGHKECWASTTLSDLTIFTLAKQTNEHWYLRLSNPSWQLPPLHQYAIVALVDFYPQVNSIAVAKSKTALEIENLKQISLLGLIENGHTITLTSDGFNEKYTLEGSAKIIDRIRNCSTD